MIYDTLCQWCRQTRPACRCAAELAGLAAWMNAVDACTGDAECASEIHTDDCWKPQLADSECPREEAA